MQKTGKKEYEKEVWKSFFKSVAVLAFDAEASYKSIEVENALRKKGKVMAKLDLFIASICLLHNLPLFTTDHDFEYVNRPEFVGLAREAARFARGKDVSEQMLTVFVHIFREWYNSIGI